MDTLNWALIGFWGCGLSLLVFGLLAIACSTAKDEGSAFVLCLIGTLLSFIGGCLFGMSLWN